MSDRDILDKARLIIDACEACKFERDTEYEKVSDELTAYSQLKELLKEEES